MDYQYTRLLIQIKQDLDLLPSVTALASNFFVKNGFVLSSLDKDEMCSIAQQSFADCGHIAFMITLELYNTILNDTSYLFSLAGYVAGEDSAFSIKLTNSENANIIEIMVTNVTK